MDIPQHIISTDVLIVGGGVTGCFAAIRAKDFPVKVILVEKASVGCGGVSPFARGVWIYWDPTSEPDPEPLVKEITESTGLMVDPKWVRIALKMSYQNLLYIIKLGAESEKDAKGNIIQLPIIGSKHGVCSPLPGGYHFMWRLRAEALRKGVEVYERVMVVDLLKQKNHVVGAVGFSTRTGDFYIFRAKSVLLAAGSLNQTSPHASSTGDGRALAFRAGAELRGMEFTGPCIAPRNLDTTGGLHLLFGSGAVLVNAKGERFMKRYNPALMERAS